MKRFYMMMTILLSMCLLTDSLYAINEGAEPPDKDAEAGKDKKKEKEKKDPEKEKESKDKDKEKGPSDPVDLAKGTFYTNKKDISIKSVRTIEFRRSYDSGLNENNVMGYNWSHSFSSRLLIHDTGNVTFVDSRFDGTDVTLMSEFKKINTGYETPLQSFKTLVVTSEGFTLIDKNINKLFFDTEGYLLRDEDTNSNTLFYTYNENKDLISVDDEFKRGLEFDYYYSTGRLKTVIDHTGRTITYGYSDNDDLNVVIFPVLPNGDTPRITYAYDAQHNLIAFTNKRNIWILINTYDDEGRVVHQKFGKGDMDLVYETKQKSYEYLTEEVENNTETSPEYVSDVASPSLYYQATYDNDSRDIAVLTAVTHTESFTSKVLDWAPSVNIYSHDQQLELQQIEEFSGRPVKLRAQITTETLAPVNYSFDQLTNKVLFSVGTQEVNIDFEQSHINDKHELVFTTDQELTYLVKLTNAVVSNSASDIPLNLPVFSKQTVVDVATTLEKVYMFNNKPVKLRHDFGNNSVSPDITYSFDLSANTVTFKQLGTTPDETPIEETAGEEPTEETPVDETPVEELPVEEPLVSVVISELSIDLTTITDQTLVVLNVAEDGSLTQTTEYNDLNDNVTEQIVKTTTYDWKGFKVEFEFDNDRRLVAETKYNADLSQSFRTVHVFDADGNKSMTTFPRGNVTRYKYDQKGSVTEQRSQKIGSVAEINADDIVNSTTYNSFSKPLTLADPNGNITTFTYDSKGNMTRVTRPLVNGISPIVNYSYNSRGQVIQKTDARSVVGDYEYFSSGPLTGYLQSKTNDASGLNQTTIYDYDFLCRVYTATDAKGNTSTYTWDDLDNMIQLVKADSNVFTQSQYDADGNILRVDRSLKNHLGDSIGDGLFSATFEYDTLSNKTKSIRELTDGNFAATNITYDLNNNLETVTDALGHTSKLTYDYNNTVISATKGFGSADAAQSQKTYDANGNLKTSILTEGGMIENEYDDFDRIIKVYDQERNDTRFSYDDKGNVLTVKKYAIDGTILSDAEFVYDALNRRTETRVKQWGLVNGENIAYSAANVLISQTDYDLNSNIIRTTNPAGGLSEYTYDTANRLLETRSLDQTNLVSKSNYSYDKNGNVLTQITYGFDVDQQQSTISHQQYVYDSLNRRIKSIYANNNETTFHYDSRNKLLKSVDAKGQVKRFEYDTAGRLVKNIEILSGDISGLPAETQLASASDDSLIDGNNTTGVQLATATVTLEDAINDITDPVTGEVTTETVTNPVVNFVDNAVSAQFELDAPTEITSLTLAKPGSEISANSVSITFTNEYGQSSVQDITITSEMINADTITLPITATTAKSFTVALNLEFTGDPSVAAIYTTELNAVAVNGSELLGLAGLPQDTTVTYSQTITTTHEYDAVNNLIASTDDQSNTTSYTYDALNRKVSQTNPDASVRSWVYSRNSYTATMTDENGTVTTFIYDDRDNIDNKSITMGNGVTGVNFVDYTYDSLGRQVTAQNFEDSQTVSRVDSVYDSLGRLVQESQAIGTNDGKTLAYNYDILGNRTQVAYPSGLTVDYTYDSVARGNSVTTTNNDLQTTINQYGYTGFRQSSETRGNCITRSFDYGLASELTAINDQLITDNVLRLSYAYDQVYNREFEHRLQNTENGAQNTGEVFSHDSLNRITSARYDISGDLEALANYDWSTDTATDKHDIALDTVHNMKAQTRGTENKTYETNNLHQVTSASDQESAFAYDTAGNMTADHKGQVFKYDYRNRIVEAQSSTNSVEFAYDAYGRRISKKVYAVDSEFTLQTSNLYFYSGAEVVEEYSNDVLVKSYILSDSIDQPIAMIINLENSETIFYYQNNIQNSIYALTDENGEIAESYSYDVYGKVKIFNEVGTEIQTSQIGNNYTFTGRRLDTETGLMYFRARYYSPELGRFISKDPIGFVDGMNLYAGYFTFWGGVDPFGLELGFNNPVPGREYDRSNNGSNQSDRDAGQAIATVTADEIAGYIPGLKQARALQKELDSIKKGHEDEKHEKEQDSENEKLKEKIEKLEDTLGDVMDRLDDLEKNNEPEPPSDPPNDDPCTT